MQISGGLGALSRVMVEDTTNQSKPSRPQARAISVANSANVSHFS
jgi:hypothetical protein